MITSLTQLEQQLEWLANVEFDTMCVHGDNPSAPALLARARGLLPRFGMRAAPVRRRAADGTARSAPGHLGAALMHDDAAPERVDAARGGDDPPVHRAGADRPHAPSYSTRTFEAKSQEAILSGHHSRVKKSARLETETKHPQGVRRLRRPVTPRAGVWIETTLARCKPTSPPPHGGVD